MSELAAMKCEACNKLTPRASANDIEKMRADLNSAWTIEDGQVLRREFKFNNFNAAFSQATAIALLAEDQGHHPDMEVGWGRLMVQLTTHAIKGLSRNDFVMAAKIDELCLV